MKLSDNDSIPVEGFHIMKISKRGRSRLRRCYLHDDDEFSSEQSGV